MALLAQQPVPSDLSPVQSEDPGGLSPESPSELQRPAEKPPDAMLVANPQLPFLLHSLECQEAQAEKNLTL